MSKKLILVLGLVFFFLGGNFARADVVISEVKISPIEDRFIKLYNQDNSTVDLTNWYIQRKTQNGTKFNSLVTSTYFKDKKINAKGYFLISRRLTENSDIVLDGLTLMESNAIQIKNPSGKVVNMVCWGDINDCGDSKFSNPASGQIIQVVSEIVDLPPVSDLGDNADIGNTSSATTTLLSEPKVKVIENPTMKVKILTNVLAFTGQPLEMQNSVVGLLNEKVVLGKAYWNFGDGSSFEQINNFEKFSHIYYYPGEYVLFLEYYQNSFSKTPEATAKMIIKVLPTTVSISKVGDIKDFFIELSNNASSDIDISNWVINASGKIFILPKNSVIMSKKQMTISGKITGFLYGDQSNLKLYSGTGELIFDYSSSLVPAKVAKTVASSTPSSILPLDKGEMPKAEGVYPDTTQASVISSGAVENNPNNSSLPIFGSIIFIGASASAVYFIRRKKVTGKEPDDFEILDE